MARLQWRDGVSRPSDGDSARVAREAEVQSWRNGLDRPRGGLSGWIEDRFGLRSAGERAGGRGAGSRRCRRGSGGRRLWGVARGSGFGFGMV